MREYKIYVPACHSGQALPLVVMLHGCKQGIDDFAAGTRMNVLAEERGFLVVYPAQASKANGSNCWNWFQPEHQQREGGEPSLIAEITREVMSEYRVDPQRVYVAGLSAGGAMAAIMGTTYPDLYAAVGIHSGLAYAAAGDVASAFAAMHGNNPNRKRTPRREASAAAMPTIVFHGDNDTTVHPSNGEDVIAQAMSASISGASHTAERGDASGRAYTRTTYRDAAGKPVTEHWLVHGAAHAWSGGSREGSYTDPRGPDASREMVRFFLQHHTG
jgi:poly(hydroxyalkanoate) depolymerase family esterase